jgi:hypothetical protein
MSVEAHINKEWAVRLVIITLMFLGGGLWFVYDGLIGWPKAQARYQLVWQPQVVKTPDGDQEVQWDLRDDWAQRLQDAGLDPNINPKDLKYHTDTDIMTQFIYAGLCVPVGLLALIWLLVNSRRQMLADDQGVKFGSRRIDYSDVTDIDKARWASKGIAVVHGNNGSRITLDEWKFRGAKDVLKEVENRTGRAAPPPQAASGS